MVAMDINIVIASTKVCTRAKRVSFFFYTYKRQHVKGLYQIERERKRENLNLKRVSHCSINVTNGLKIDLRNSRQNAKKKYGGFAKGGCQPPSLSKPTIQCKIKKIRARTMHLFPKFHFFQCYIIFKISLFFSMNFIIFLNFIIL